MHRCLLYFSSFFAALGSILVSFVSHSEAQSAWAKEGSITLHRGLLAHTIYAQGASGRRDPVLADLCSFSYPQGRRLKVYSGGVIRRGWNNKLQTGGEGIWIMSKTNGSVHVSTVGSEKTTDDAVSLPHDPAAYPEAYLGVVHHEDWALAYRQQNGNEIAQTAGTDLVFITANYWPASHEVPAAPTPIVRKPVGIWNFRYGRYNTGQTFADRIAADEFSPLPAPARSENLSEDDFPEVIGIQKGHSAETGLVWTRKWYQWGHDDYNDFLINETAVENTSSEIAEDVYIVFQNRFISSSAWSWREGYSAWPAAGHPWARDDHTRSTAASNYLEGVSRDAFVNGEGKPAGLQLGKDLADQGHPMLYNHDGESDHIDNLGPDVGDPYRYDLAKIQLTRGQPWLAEGNIQQGQYFGIGLIDAHPPFNTYGGPDPDPYVAPHDNPDTPLDESQKQPASITIWKYHDKDDFEHPSPLFDTPAFLYDTLTLAGYPDEPADPYNYSNFFTFGPYTLAPGEKCKVVVAYVGALAANAPKYADYKRYPQPFHVSWMNLNGPFNQSKVKFAERQREIPLGEDALFEHFQRAISIYNWGYDVPNQPPNVKLSWHGDLDGHTVLTWSSFGEDSPDPDYEGDEARDITGYRIYRSSGEVEGPWEFVTEFAIQDARVGSLPTHTTYDPNGVYRTNLNTVFPEGIPLRQNKYVSGLSPDAGAEIPGLYSFTDIHSRAGFPNWYSVRLIDSGHSDWKNTGMSVSALESAPGPSGGAVVGAKPGIVPILGGSSIFDEFTKQVKTVPNPYRSNDDLHSYNQQQKIRFINLPGRCQIDLYTVAGERFWTFFNNDPTRGEVTWNQNSEGGLAGGNLSPGIYFWKVTSYMPQSIGQAQKGTITIIR